MITKDNPYKIWKTWKSRKSKLKLLKLTVANNYIYGIIIILVNEDLYGFQKGEKYYVAPKDVKIINEREMIIILDETNKDVEEYNKQLDFVKREKKKEKEGKIQKKKN